MHWGWKWTIIFLATGLVDYGLRLATRFNMDWVVPLEAVLFFGAGYLFWRLERRNPAQVPWQHVVQLVVVASFALGGLRSALWALGLPVSRANLVILLLGVALAGIAWRRRSS
jgi:hypothetical protein